MKLINELFKLIADVFLALFKLWAFAPVILTIVVIVLGVIGFWPTPKNSTPLTPELRAQIAAHHTK